MVLIKSDEAEIKAALTAASLMVASARTAPKGKGVDKITTAIATDEDKERLAQEMAKIFTPSDERIQKQIMNVRNSDAVVLIGVKIEDEMDETERTIRIVDLGIAIGSAVKTASILNIDNRVMLSVGRAAQELKLIEGSIVYGIPISVRGSNIFFDRYDPMKKSWQEQLASRELKKE
jgi:uncharacterized ferredoxin-like protein